jgi:transcriptional/translational regulatory protein YebC/TACO1
MSKIVAAINTMLLNSDKITNVGISHYNEQEIFFKYLKKQNWSIMKTPDSNFIVYYYPNNDIEILKTLDASSNDFQGVQMVKYATNEIKTKEAYETFEELFTMLQEKTYNLDEVFDEIFKNDDSGNNNPRKLKSSSSDK